MTYKYQRDIASGRAFVNDDSFELIVKMCKLKPRKTWKIWEDEGGNTLRLQKDHNCHIYPSGTETKSKDIYRKSKPAQIANASHWALLGFGRESAVWFLGNDGRLRASWFENGVWKENRLPLLSGIEILKLITRLMTVSKLHKVDLDKFDCAYATGLPLKDKIDGPFVDSVLKECGINVG